METLRVGGKAEVPGYTVGGATLIGTVTRLGRKTVAVEITVPSTGVRRVRTFPVEYVKAYVEPVAGAAAEGFHHVQLRCAVCGLVRIPLSVKPSAFAAAHAAEHKV